MPRKKLALVGGVTYANCANQTYINARARALSTYFDVQILNTVSEISDDVKHWDELYKQCSNFDLVNIDCELGFFGKTIPLMKERLINLINASEKVIFTMHRIDTGEDHKEFSILYAEIIKTLRDRPLDKPFFILVHTPRDKRVVELTHAIKNVDVYPVCYFQEKEISNFRDHERRTKWRKKHGFNDDHFIVGVFGVLAAYKEPNTVIKAIEHLPDNYHLAFIGGEHEISLHAGNTAETDRRLNFIHECISCSGDKKLIERIHFLGTVYDTNEFNLAMASVNYVVVSHKECGQSASGVLSTALQLGCRIVASKNSNIMEYHRVFFDASFEMFDPHNFMELKHKIQFFDYLQPNHHEKSENHYSLNGLAKRYVKLSDLMDSKEYTNEYEPGKIEALISKLSMQPTQVLTNAYPMINRLTFNGYLLKYIPNKLKNTIKYWL